MDFFNTVVIFIPEVFILCKKVCEPKGPGGVNFDIPCTRVTSPLSVKNYTYEN